MKGGKNKNNLKKLLILTLLLLVAFFIFQICLAEDELEIKPGDVVINEVMWMGSSISSSDEWIELKNTTSNKIDFEENPWSICKDNKLLIKIDKGNIKPNKYYLISNNKKDHDFSKGKSILNIDPDLINSKISLSNDGAQYKLYAFLANDEDCEDKEKELALIDIAGKKNYNLAGENEDIKKSMERNSEIKDGTNESSWHTCCKASNLDDTTLDCGTPGEKNSDKDDCKKDEDEEKEAADYNGKIIINEIYPAPLTKNGEREFVEIIYTGQASFDVSDLCLKEENEYSKEKGKCKKISEVKSNDNYYIFYGTFGLNSGAKGDTVFILDNNNNIIDKQKYENSKSSLSYSFDGKNWRWTSRPTPGEKNKFDKILTGEIKMDKNIYKDMYANFEVKTDKDTKKFTWDFGDGHKSYLKKTRHKYEKEGKYKASLRLRGNGEEKTYSFTVEVEKFKAPEIKIVAISPNPAGKDSENEWIEIKNQSKKDVNLKNWSVATGWDNLYNHPIRVDFEIKKGKTKKLERDICAFTLNNTKTKIELRDPTGKVVHKIKYNREENKISEDEIYEKVDEKWIWINPNPPKIEAEKQVPGVTENIPNPEKQIIDPALLGRYSPYSAWQKRAAYRIELISYATNINMPSITNKPLVFGANTIKKSGNYYSFTASSRQKHWALKLLESLWIKINSFINRNIVKLI